MDTLPAVQSSNTANCIGIQVHNTGSAAIAPSSQSLVLNGNCISSVSSSSSSAQRYRLDTLQPANCSPVPQHGVITSSAAPSSLTTTLMDVSHNDSKTRGKLLKQNDKFWHKIYCNLKFKLFWKKSLLSY